MRPDIRYFSSAKLLIDLPNEEVCIAMSWSGDYAQAMMRGKQAGKPVPLAYSTQKEGSLAWFDVWFILADAPHPGNAHLFLNYLLRPEVAAPISIETRYATPNLKAKAMLPPEVPTERTAELRAAFAAVFRDERFIADATKVGIEVDPVSGEQIAALIARIEAVPQPAIDRLRRLVE